MPYILISLLWLCQPSTIKATPTDSLLSIAQQAVEAQQNGQDKTAIQSYEKVLAQGHYSAELYNNLGLAYAKQGTLGKAIVQWERALRWNAQSADAQQNLKAAQQYIARPITATPPIFLVRGWQQLHQWCSAKSWALLFLLFWGLAFVAFGLAWKKDPAHWKEQVASKVALGILVLSFVPLGLAWAQQNQEQETNVAIVIAKEAGLRPYPELSSKEMEVLSEGVRLYVLEQEGDWLKVELPNYLVGWVPKSLVERV